MRATKLFTILCVTQASIAAARFTDDSMLSLPKAGIFARIPPKPDFYPDIQDTLASAPNKAQIQIILDVDGVSTPIRGLRIQWGTQFTQTDDNGLAEFPECSTAVEATAILRVDAAFQIEPLNKSKPYIAHFPIVCGQGLLAKFENQSTGGEAFGAFRVARLAYDRIQQSAGSTGWRGFLKIVTHNGASYYDILKDIVFVSYGHEWDVVAHEIGHFVYDQFKIGEFGTGFHRVSSCYNSTLALSEGWASAFAAWLLFPTDAPNTSFKYLAGGGIFQLESVPETVCKGPNNEWRVAAFIWDLLDQHDDGERVEQTSFMDFLKLTQGKKSNSMTRFVRPFVNSNFPESFEVSRAWNLTFPGTKLPAPQKF
jgi:hypothetical protein